MQAPNHTTARQGRGKSPLLDELQRVYDVLDDAALIEGSSNIVGLVDQASALRLCGARTLQVSSSISRQPTH